ncbi:MAG: MMPL family transporter [Sphingomonadales bacterium]
MAKQKVAENSLVKKLARFYFGNAWLILAIALLLAAGAFTRIVKLDVNTNLQALMPEGVPSVTNLEKVLEKTGSFASAMVVINSPDPDAAVRFARVMQVQVMRELDWVASADYAEDFSLFEGHKLLYQNIEDLETLKDWAASQANKKRDEILSQLTGLPVNVQLRTQPGPKLLTDDQIEEIRNRIEDPDSPVLSRGSQRLFQSDDQEVTLLVVWPKDSSMSLAASKRIIEDLQRIAGTLRPETFHPEMTVEIGGRIYNRVVQFDAILNDVKSSGLISISLIILLLTLYFRSLASVVYLVVPLATGIIWTLGVTQMVLGGLNLITIFLVLILFGLGIDFGIHGLSRYREARLTGSSVEHAICIILSRTGAASLMAGITTAIGFFALLVTDFRAFYEFGFIAGSGIILTYISTHAMLPAMLVVAERFKIYRAGKIFVLPFKLKGATYPYPRRTLIGIAGLLVVFIFFSKGVEFENDFGKLQAQRSEQHSAMQTRIAKVFPDGTDRAVLIVDTLGEVKIITDYFNDYIANDPTPTIRKIDSIFSYLPEAAEQEERLKIIKEIKDSLGGVEISLEDEGLGDGNLQTYLDIGKVTPDDLPEGLKRVYKGLPDTPGYLLYIFNLESMNLADKAREFANDIREFTVAGTTYFPATETLIFVDMLNLMKAEAVLAILAVSIVTLIMLFIFFRNIKCAFLVLSPTLAGLAILFGIMGLFDIRLSIFNMVILPTIIGIGVDNGIHIYHRYREEKGSVMKVLFTTGGAAAVTTITTALGFSGMLTASMGGLRSLGILATIGLAACLFTSWTLFPALLQKKKEVLEPGHIPFEADT